MGIRWIIAGLVVSLTGAGTVWFALLFAALQPKGTIHILAPPTADVAVFLDGRKLGDVPASEHTVFGIGRGKHHVQLLIADTLRRPNFGVDVTDASWTAVVPTLPVQCFRLFSGDATPTSIRSTEPVLLPHDADLRIERERCGGDGHARP